MSRGLTVAVKNATAAGVVYPVLFAFLDFAGGAMYLCTHIQNIVWNSNTWTGLGDFGKISPVQETGSTQANGLTFSLSGIPSSLLGEVLVTRSRGRTATLWLGCFDASGNLLADPFQLWSGRMDQPVIIDSGDKSEINISAESRLADLGRSRERRYTDEDQNAFFPGDTGLEFVAQLQTKEVVWGKADAALNQPASGGGAGSGGYIDHELS